MVFGLFIVLVFISMIYNWFEVIDGNGVLVWVFFFDYWKVFDLID